MEENTEQVRGRGALTYADDIHEAVHAVADLKQQILPLPLGCRAEWSWLAVFQNKVLDVDGMKVKLQVRGGGCGVGR